jgi:hypothetical protein
MEEAKAKMSGLLAPVVEREASNDLHSLWIPRPDTLSGAFSDGALEAFIDALHLPERTVIAYCQHRGGKLIYFLSQEDKDAFLEAVGASTLVKVGPSSHLFRATDPSKAALAVTFLVLGVPLAARDEEVESLLTLIASPNPSCSLVSWTRVTHRGSITDKVAARWTIAPEMVLTERSINLGDVTLSFAPQEHTLKCTTCKIKGHDDRRCPFASHSTSTTAHTPATKTFKSSGDFLNTIRGYSHGTSPSSNTEKASDKTSPKPVGIPVAKTLDPVDNPTPVQKPEDLAPSPPKKEDMECKPSSLSDEEGDIVLLDASSPLEDLPSPQDVDSLIAEVKAKTTASVPKLRPTAPRSGGGTPPTHPPEPSNASGSAPPKSLDLKEENRRRTYKAGNTPPAKGQGKPFVITEPPGHKKPQDPGGSLAQSKGPSHQKHGK